MFINRKIIQYINRFTLFVHSADSRVGNYFSFYKSYISYADFANAVLDEIEKPQYLNVRIKFVVKSVLSTVKMPVNSVF